MGSNFINSVLEEMTDALKSFISEHFAGIEPPEVNMAILSNYTPDCLAEAYVECPVDKLDDVVKGMSGYEFAQKFKKAVDISMIDISRATTHNKGIFNGIDALAMATGNDWRALEAGAHAFATRNGSYQGLTNVSINNNTFRFEILLPVNIGTVGGVTSLHPVARLAMQILKKPSAGELMQLFAAVGLASNFSAVTALIGAGIQQGHMKLHLQNILLQLNASNEEKQRAMKYFKDKKVSHSQVREFLNQS